MNVENRRLLWLENQDKLPREGCIWNVNGKTERERAFPGERRAEAEVGRF